MWGSFLAPTATAAPHAGRTGLLDIPLSILHQKNFDIPLEGGPKRMTAKAHRQAPEGARLYDIDVVAWANEQARLLRSGRLDQLDIEHTAEETLLDQTLVRVDRETYEHFLAVLDQPPAGEGYERLMAAPSPWKA